MFMLLDMAVLLLAILPAIVSCSRRDIYRADHGVPQCEITGSLDSLFGSIFKPGEPGGIICVTRNDSVVYKTPILWRRSSKMHSILRRRGRMPCIW